MRRLRSVGSGWLVVPLLLCGPAGAACISLRGLKDRESDAVAGDGGGSGAAESGSGGVVERGGGGTGDTGAGGVGTTGAGTVGTGTIDTGATGGGGAPVLRCDVPTGGLYCGNNDVEGGDAHTLYQCYQGTATIDKECPFGCERRPDGTNDRCKGGTAGEIATQLLGRSRSFLIGLGHAQADEQVAHHELGITLDLHDHLVDRLADPTNDRRWSTLDQALAADDRNGVVPMVTLSLGTLHTLSWPSIRAILADQTAMRVYWDNVTEVFRRLARTGAPRVVNLEPYLFAHAQDQAAPAVATLHLQECKWMTADLNHFGRCLMHLAHVIAPNVVVGFHATSGLAGPPASDALTLDRIGASDADILIVSVLDRDAGCYESGDCSSDGGPWYWETEDRFTEYIHFVQKLSEDVGRPVLWWQVPLGQPSDTPGGTPKRYRDNRVRYFFDHLSELVSIGALGAVFGSGDVTQTDIDSDDGQFRDAVREYLLGGAHPLP
ncbi:hypothetical protein WMF26_11520 [Sorangium sp. So ce185]|uniref:hypothetical protein n=1 Tax=Sorangium sp. So ce185 TaxID=3133287 RepID=UPI003F5FA0A8